MGRTNPTYRDALEAMAERWRDYRRGLRRRDKPRFDRLFDYAREHADAAGHLNHEDPRWPLLVSIALAQEARIDDLQSRVDDLEARIDGLDSRVETLEARLDAAEREGDETGEGSAEPTVGDD